MGKRNRRIKRQQKRLGLSKRSETKEHINLGGPSKTNGSAKASRSLKTGEDYPLEDRALKAAAQLMGDELLPLLGVRGTVEQIAPTEQVFLEIKDLLADFNYVMEDGSWCHLEFESDSITMDDLRRFRAYEAVLSYHYKVDVVTCVLCSSTVKRLKRGSRQGYGYYRIQVVRMKDKDADVLIRRLEKKQGEKQHLARQELLELLLSPLMGGKMAQEERIRRSLELLEKEQGRLGQGELVRMQSVLYAFAMKFLGEDELERIRRVLDMTVLGKMLTADAIERGRMEGRIEKGKEAILDLLDEIGGAPARLSARISAERDDATLRRWLRLAAKVDSVEQFEQMM